MRTLAVDIETYSGTDLKQAGVYRYVEASDFEITLFAFAFDDDPVTVMDLLDFEEIPTDVFTAMTDPNVVKTAWNAAFERTALAKHFGVTVPAQQWRCSMVHALYLGLPGSLDQAGKVGVCVAMEPNHAISISGH